MEVVVEDKQLSLAIGKKGQNVRLAAKLTGWQIDIKSEEEKRQEVESQLGALELGDAAPAESRSRSRSAQAEAAASADGAEAQAADDQESPAATEPETVAANGEPVTVAADDAETK